MTLLKLDHIAVACTTLDEGTAYIEAALGTTLSPEGQHKEMGTHNRLLSLGPQVYFELIAIDPNAKRPDRPRWFNIDAFEGPPRLTNWILQTPDMNAALACLPKGFGTPMTLERGDFRWKMAVPDTGVLPWGGWAPAIIQWLTPAHPAPRLSDAGIRLDTLCLKHPQADDIASTLAPHMPRDTALFQVDETPQLVATFQTPTGPVTLT